MIKSQVKNKIKVCVEELNYYLIDIKNIKNEYKLIIKDKLGYIYTPFYKNIKRGCIPKIVGTGNEFSIQNIKRWCFLNNKVFELLSNTYILPTENLVWKCKKCGEVFKSSWNNIQQGDNCPFCRGLKVGLSNCLAMKNPDLAKEWHPIKNGDLTPYDVTENSNKKAWWICKDNSNHIWYTSIINRSKNNSNCPYCIGRYPSEENNLLIKNPSLCEDWNYVKNYNTPDKYCPNSGDKVWWKCHICGYEWQAIIDSRNRGQRGCSSCSESKGEKQVSKILNKLNICSIQQYKFSDCKNITMLEFDFYLPEYNTCIEYQGIQHYEPIDFASRGYEWALEQFDNGNLRDQIKRDYCKNNNIKLLEIPYWEFDNIEKILFNELKLNNIKAGDISA